MKFKSDIHGITLVSLIVTIIILLILAGISIQAITNTGLFEGANQAKKEAKRSQIVEWLNLKLIEEQAKNPIGTAEEIIEATRVVSYGNEELAKMGEKVVVDENTSTQEDGKQVAVYFYVQVDEDVYKVEMSGAKFIGEQGKFPPVITIESITKTTNSITVKIKTSRNEKGKIEFYIKKEGETKYTPKYTAEGEEAKGLEYKFENLEQNKKYSIRIVAIAKNEQVKEYITEVSLGSVPEGERKITFSPVTWTNGKASTTISSTETGYTIQYQKNSTSEIGWTTGTSVTGLVHGDKLYARFWDGTNGGTAAVNNILDGIDPSASIELSSTNTTTKDSITATVTHIDNESGVNIENCKWVYNTTETAIGTNIDSYTGGTFSSNPQTITLSTTTEGSYYLHVLTTDVAGRVKETVSTEIVVEKKGAVYGTSIQSNYATLYTTDYPNGFTEKTNYDTYYSGNYDRSYALMTKQKEKRLDRSSDDRYTYISTGTNKIDFLEQVTNRWVGLDFECGYLTTSVSISNIKLNFSDNSSIVVDEAVKNDYIEPLVICASPSNLNSCKWNNISNILQGGTSGSASYPRAILELKVKSKAAITGIEFYTNRSWNTTGDGFRSYKYYENYEISTEPLN